MKTNASSYLLIECDKNNKIHKNIYKNNRTNDNSSHIGKFDTQSVSNRIPKIFLFFPQDLINLSHSKTLLNAKISKI